MNQTNKKVIWLDCDPGHDDMVAIILAALSEQCQLIGISTSAGNSTIQNTTQNTLNILTQINKEDIPVYRGSQHPLCSQLNVAPQIHGANGLEGAQLKQSKKQAIKQECLLKIYKKIMEQTNPIEFVVTGAMTNLAILIKAFPKILEKIKGITIMGGAIGIGNWSPAAQFNILVDPQAAHIVFNCGIKVVMIPLETTHTVQITNQVFAAIKQINHPFTEKIYSLFKYFQVKYKENQNFQFPVLHDPCTIYYLLRPEHFVGRDSLVEIQLQGKSRGRTNCSFMHLKKKPNAYICQKINVEEFWKYTLKIFRMIK